MAKYQIERTQVPDQTQNPTAPSPPYFAFKTLTNLLVRMEEHGPPNRVDRTFLKEMSGAGQTQFIAGLKSLGLIDDEGAVQPRLAQLVSEPDNRPALIGEILRERYPDAVALGRTNATTGELVELFGTAHGVKGDTARKAIAFYLQAAKYAGDVPLSPHFKTPSVASGNGGARKRGRPRKDSGAGEHAARTRIGGAPSGGLHPALVAILDDLPRNGKGWTTERREEWKKAWETMLTYSIPVVTTDEADEADADSPEDEEW
jgi:hypothetical protein